MKQDLLEKPILVTTIIGGSITRLIAVLFSTYLILWIQSFPGHKEGDISKDIYFNIMIIAVIMAIIYIYRILIAIILLTPAFTGAPALLRRGSDG